MTGPRGTRHEETAVPRAVTWVWRIIPRYSKLPDVDAGTEPTEREAKHAAERALRNPRGIAALVYPVDLRSGTWVTAGQPQAGLRTLSGQLVWFDPVTATWRRT